MPARGRAPTDHRIGVRLREDYARELAGAAADRAEQRAFRIALQLVVVEISGEIFLEVVVARHIACRLPPFSRNRTHAGGSA